MSEIIEDVTNTSIPGIPKQGLVFPMNLISFKSLVPKIFVIFAIVLLTIIISCNEDSTGIYDNLPNGRRDYVWTVDTLNIPFTTLQRIWGSSPTDVWAIGPGGDKDKTIFHFDGIRWKTDGITRPLAPTSIFGFSPNNVWIGGRGGEIWNFNGSIWAKIFGINIPNYNFYGFENIWGNSPDNVYAVGYAEDSLKYKGIIAKYDGLIWKNLEIPEVQNSFVEILRGTKSSNNYFILAIRFEQFAEDTSYIYEFDGVNLNKIYQGITTAQELAGLYCIEDMVYIRKGYDVFKYLENKLTWFLRLPGEATLWGRNDRDVFLGLRDGVSHYNGNDISSLIKFNSAGIRITGGLVFEKEVFFLALDINSGLNLVFRGALK